jgi:creatinine amidohydrolase
MAPEVRYHMLRPQQIVERRTACLVVCIPIGTLMWQGGTRPEGIWRSPA